MELIIVGVLVLLVCHAGSKVVTLEAQVTAANGTANLPPNTSVPATGGTPTPSPATALGAAGAAGSVQLQYQTNAPYALPLPSYYQTGAEQAGLNGVPLPFVPTKQWNGFNAVPARTKSLATGAPAASTGPSRWTPDQVWRTTGGGQKL